MARAVNNFVKFNVEELRYLLSAKGTNAADIGRTMGRNTGWLNQCLNRGTMKEADLKFVSLLLGAEMDELLLKEKAEEPETEAKAEPKPESLSEDILKELSEVKSMLVVLDRNISDMALSLIEVRSELFKIQGKAPKSSDQIAAERLLKKMLNGKRHCDYQAYVNECKLRGIRTDDYERAYRSLHCELRKHGYGKAQRTHITLIEGYELKGDDDA